MSEPVSAAAAAFKAVVAAIASLGRLTGELAKAITIPEKMDAMIARVQHSRKVRQTADEVEKLAAEQLSALKFERDGIRGTIKRLCNDPKVEDLKLLRRQIQSSRDVLVDMLKTIKETSHFEARFPKDMDLVRQIREGKLDLLDIISNNAPAIERYVKNQGRGMSAKERKELLSKLKGLDEEFDRINGLIDDAKVALAQYLRNQDALLTGSTKRKN